MKFRRRAGGVAREDIAINLAPLIDVIFVLLLFFVVSTTFTKPTQLKVELPEATSGTPPENNQAKQLEITISLEGHYALNGKRLVQDNLETLMTAMQRESAGDKDLPVLINADGKANYQAVVTAMDAAGKLGFTHLRIATVETAEAQPDKP